MCGSCANEGALKAAFMAYRARERGEASQEGFSADEVKLSCLPEFLILSSSFKSRLGADLVLSLLS